jgi:hypothetical protein
VRLPTRINAHNHDYLIAKQRKLGHDLELDLTALQRQRRPSIDALLEEQRMLRQLSTGEL